MSAILALPQRPALWVPHTCCAYPAGREVLQVLTLLALVMVPIQATAETVTYGELVAALRSAPNAVQAEFAEVVLAQLDASYLAAARRSAGTRWQASVDHYRARLRALAVDLGPDTAVSLRTGLDRRTQVLIGDTVVIVSSPRASQQAQLERRITDRFCANYLCQQLQFASDASGRAAGGVSFGFDIQQDAGLSCNSGDGLEFLFFARDHVAERRRWCRQIVAELRTLGWALRQRVAVGVIIEWQDFAILPASEPIDGAAIERDSAARTYFGASESRKDGQAAGY